MEKGGREKRMEDKGPECVIPITLFLGRYDIETACTLRE
jgi:hypothetical protein